VSDQIYVGVGDHSDRALERSASREQAGLPERARAGAWLFEPMRVRWDACVLAQLGRRGSYQEVSVAAFLHPDDVLATLRRRVSDLPPRDCYPCSAAPSRAPDQALGFGTGWSFELEDPVAGRRIRHGYAIRNPSTRSAASSACRSGTVA
jgi:hypothetical protein